MRAILFLGAALLSATLQFSAAANAVEPAPKSAALLGVTIVYKLTAYSPSRGEVGTREVAIPGVTVEDCEFKVTFAQQAFLKEKCGDEIGAVVTREVVKILN